MLKFIPEERYFVDVNDSIHHVTDSDLLENLIKAHDILFQEYSLLPEILREQCFPVMCGGFVLQNILGETWYESDIDIFADLKRIPEIPIYDMVITKNRPKLVEYVAPNGKKHQLIQKTYRQTDQFSSSFSATYNFDLSLCRVAFNGNIMCADSILNDLINKEMHLYSGLSPMQTRCAIRIKKYVDRGFKVMYDGYPLEYYSIWNLRIKSKCPAYDVYSPNNNEATVVAI